MNLYLHLLLPRQSGKRVLVSGGGLGGGLSAARECLFVLEPERVGRAKPGLVIN